MPSGANPRRITIVGGGYSGAAAAVQLARAATAPLAVTLVEPRPEPGAGLAYSAEDPDHRLNGSPENHFIDPRDTGEFRRWCEREGLMAADPEALAPDGTPFVRRRAFGAFMAAAVREQAARAGAATLRHLRDTARDAWEDRDALVVATASGQALASDLVVVATGNALPRLPAPFAALQPHPGLIGDPFALERVRAIPPAARVLVLGGGLTALDIASTLVRAGHRGPVTVVSRRGLRPRPHRCMVAGPPAPDAALLERIEGPVPEFVQAAGPAPSARALLRALRGRIRSLERPQAQWYAPFDALRDVLWKVWPTLATAEKRRVLRHLRPWYDAHRFRAPPQNDALVRGAEARGEVAYRTMRARAARIAPGGAIEVDFSAREGTCTLAFDAVVNCTGLDPASGARDNPFLAALLARGLARVDPTGVGLAVDAQCRALGRDGTAHERLRVIGPPTAGTFGDPLGAMFIAAQVRRILPGMLAAIERSPAPCR